MTIMQMIEKRNKAIEAARAFAAAHKNENGVLNDTNYAEYEQIIGRMPILTCRRSVRKSVPFLLCSLFIQKIRK